MGKMTLRVTSVNQEAVKEVLGVEADKGVAIEIEYATDKAEGTIVVGNLAATFTVEKKDIVDPETNEAMEFYHDYIYSYEVEGHGSFENKATFALSNNEIAERCLRAVIAKSAAKYKPAPKASNAMTPEQKAKRDAEKAKLAAMRGKKPVVNTSDDSADSAKESSEDGDF